MKVIGPIGARQLTTTMAVAVSGGGWEGGGDSDAINRDLLEYLQVKL